MADDRGRHQAIISTIRKLGDPNRASQDPISRRTFAFDKHKRPAALLGNVPEISTDISNSKSKSFLVQLDSTVDLIKVITLFVGQIAGSV